MHITKKSLVEGLSYALDIAENNYLSHAKRVTYTSMKIAARLKGVHHEHLFYAALIHDIGVGNSYGLKEHSAVGADIVKKLPLDPLVSTIIRYHHEYHDRSGPYAMAPSDVPIEAKIILAANVMDSHLSGKAATLETLNGLHQWLDDIADTLAPGFCEILKDITGSPYFLLDYFGNNIDTVISNESRHIPDDYLSNDDIVLFAQVFSDIIDQRNHFTHDHSNGIASTVQKVVTAFGYSEERCQQMYIAALLHDLGKLSVCNDILDKPGPLNAKERYEINTHPYYTRWILSKIPGFEQVTEWAANHHEKLNGTGYPYGYKAHQLDEPSRIMSIVDIYQALTESRPYRAPMSRDKAWAIVDSMVADGELDGTLVTRIKAII